MKYPYMLKIGRQGAGFFIYLQRGPTYPDDVYEAANAEELLVFLMGVYDWYPEGYSGCECDLERWGEE